MKMAASAGMAKKVMGNWRNKALMETFQSWAEYVRVKHIREMKDALDAALEDKDRLDEKVAKLQRKLDKATNEKKALLEEVNRHVGLLL